MSEVTYVAPDAPSFKTRLVIETEKGAEDRWLEFKNKQLVLDSEKDAAAIAAFDAAIARNPALSQQVKKLDREAAEKVAKQHREMMLAQSGGVTGPVTSQSESSRTIRMEQEKQRMLAQGMSDEEASEKIAEAFGEKGISVEQVEDPVIQKVPEAEPEKTDDTVKQTFANLGKK